MKRILGLLAVVALTGVWSTSARAEKKRAVATAGAASKMRVDVSVNAGWTRIADSTKTDTVGGDTDTAAGLPRAGLSVAIRPYKSLAVELGYDRGLTNIDTNVAGLSPSDTDLTWWRLQLAAGWDFPLHAGPIHTVTPMLGYNVERWSSQRQTPTQMTPSWKHSDLRLGAKAYGDLMANKLAVTGGLFFVPLMSVSEDFKDNGNNPGGVGLDVSARADYDVGVPTNAGNLWVGGQLGWGLRRISYDGAGSRTASDFATPVQDVKESYGRIEFMLYLTLRYGGAGKGHVLES